MGGQVQASTVAAAAAAAAGMDACYEALKPLQRLRLGLQHSMQLADAMTQALQARMPAAALRVEMQVRHMLLIDPDNSQDALQHRLPMLRCALMLCTRSPATGHVACIQFLRFM